MDGVGFRCRWDGQLLDASEAHGNSVREVALVLCFLESLRTAQISEIGCQSHSFVYPTTLISRSSQLIALPQYYTGFSEFASMSVAKEDNLQQRALQESCRLPPSLSGASFDATTEGLSILYHLSHNLSSSRETFPAISQAFQRNFKGHCGCSGINSKIASFYLDAAVHPARRPPQLALRLYYHVFPIAVPSLKPHCAIPLLPWIPGLLAHRSSLHRLVVLAIASTSQRT